MSKKKPYGYWKNPENTLKEVMRIMKKHELETIPSQKKLNELGYSGLNIGIRYFPGKTSGLKEAFGENITSKLMRKMERKIGEDLESFLRREYKKENKTIIEIAERLGIVNSTVGKWLKKYNIPIRSRLENNLKGKKKPSKKKLKKLYFEKNRTICEIAEMSGVSRRTASSWLDEYNLQKKTLSETKLKDKKKPTEKQLRKLYIGQNMYLKEIACLFGISKTTTTRYLDEYNIPIRTISESKLKGKSKLTEKQLKNRYITKKKSASEIANSIGVSEGTIYLWLKKCDIPRRTTSEARLKCKSKPTKKQLKRLYTKGGKSQKEIAKMIGVSPPIMRGWLIEYNLISMKKIRNFKKKSPLVYFQEKYGDREMTRSQLQKEDNSLYNILRREEQLDEAIPYNYRGYESPLACFQDKFGNRNMTKSQLAKKDPGLYNILLNKGQLDQALSGAEPVSEKEKLEFILREYVK